jgi:hypothetical protein
MSNAITNNSFILYPNPTTGTVLIVASANYKFALSNSIGAVIETGENVKMLDLSKYSNGIYYIAITSEEGKTTYQKIILIK